MVSDFTSAEIYRITAWLKVWAAATHLSISLSECYNNALQQLHPTKQWIYAVTTLEFNQKSRKDAEMHMKSTILKLHKLPELMDILDESRKALFTKFSDIEEEVYVRPKFWCSIIIFLQYQLSIALMLRSTPIPEANTPANNIIRTLSATTNLLPLISQLSTTSCITVSWYYC